jgi:hypothetical protein
MRELQEFVARMARLSTPYDPDVMAKAHAAADPDGPTTRLSPTCPTTSVSTKLRRSGG